MTVPEIWLRGGMIVDGTGSEPYLGDVALRADTISRITPPGAVRAQPDQEVDCKGLTVVPGFIDIHTHSDLSFILDPSANSKLMQGVTTEVVGNCGFSPFPVASTRRDLLAEFLSGLGLPRVPLPWSSFADYAEVLDSCRPIMNVAPLVGHGALRIAAAGMENVPVGREMLERMTSLLRRCLDEGVFGLSTGLTYVPSEFANPSEIHALARVVREHDALYATHARGTVDVFSAVDEAIEVGRVTDARVQYSHVALNDPQLWGHANDIIQRFQQAADSGVDIRYDVYPYDASASSLTQYLPAWVQEDGEDGLRRLTEDDRRFARACADFGRGLYQHIPWDWTRVHISLAGSGDQELEGLTISDAARLRSISPEELCIRLAAKHGNLVQVVLFYRMKADVQTFLVHPLAIVGSDGIALSTTVPGRPHPRSFGTHARLLQRFVTDISLLTLADAVRKMTHAPAQRLNLVDRGTIARGMRADVAVLDLDAIQENATWTNPCQLATGVRDVFVNGVHTLADSAITSRRAGQVLRH